MAKHDVKLMQIFKRYLNKPGDEVVIAGSAVSVGPLMKQKVVLRAQYHDEDAESAPYRIDKAIEWAERNQCVVLERKRRIMNDGSEIAELVVDVKAISNAVRSRNAYGTNYIDEGDRVWVVSEKKKGTIKSFTTTKGPQPIITVKYDDGSVGVADAKDIRVIPNSLRSRNSVVQKALNASRVARNSSRNRIKIFEWPPKVKNLPRGSEVVEYDGHKALLYNIFGRFHSILTRDGWLTSLVEQVDYDTASKTKALEVYRSWK